MKAYRIVTYITDYEEVGKETILWHLTNQKYISVEVGAISEIDIGEWDDDHPLNHRDTDVEAYFQERIK